MTLTKNLPLKTTFAIALAVGLSAVTIGSTHAATIAFEAESFASESGSGFDIIADVDALGGQYITTATNSTTNGTPPNTVTYNVSFPEAGDYNLYLRLLIPSPSASSHDSMFVPDNVGTPTGWERVNELDSETEDDEYEWLNLTTLTDPDRDAPLYDVAAAGPTTFSLGGREDGLRIDAVVLSTDADLTDEQLTAAVPEPASLAMGLVGLTLLAMRRGRPA